MIVLHYDFLLVLVCTDYSAASSEEPNSMNKGERISSGTRFPIFFLQFKAPNYAVSDFEKTVLIPVILLGAKLKLLENMLYYYEEKGEEEQEQNKKGRTKQLRRPWFLLLCLLFRHFLFGNFQFSFWWLHVIVTFNLLTKQ